MDDKNKRVVGIYDEIAEDYAKNYDPIDSEEDLIFPKTFLSNLKPKSNILDIGCGTGFSSGWFVKNGMNTEGIDLSSSMIDIAKRNYPNIQFSVADMRTFRPKGKVDAVWAGYSMFHFDQSDFEKSIETIKTYLKPKGIFGLVMQEGEGEVEFPEPFMPEKNTYVHLYTLENLTKILNNHSFEVLEYKKKNPMHPNEFNFNKILLITRFN